MIFGCQPPSWSHVELGIEAPIMERLTDWELSRKLNPIKIAEYKFHQMPSDYMVDVTWIQTISGFVGKNGWEDGLRPLLTIENHEQYRMVSAVG